MHAQARGIRYLQDKLKDCQVKSQSTLSLANQNRQYSQKNNIQFMNRAEKPNENLCNELCSIPNNSIYLVLDPKDVFEIHRIPSGHQNGPLPVIAKFRNSKILKAKGK